MGKRIIAQRRGKGSPTYRTPAHKFRPHIRYRDISGIVREIRNDTLRNTPVAEIRYEDNTTGYILAPLGTRVGDKTDALVQPLRSISIGTPIFCLETYPNSGPKLCRTSGSGALIVSKSKGECVVQLPSKKNKKLDARCRATIGRPAGEGRDDKPWVKAGKRYRAMHARGKLYPRTSAVAMNALDHPFGGGYTGLGKSKTVSRSASPGRKAGSIGARRTGRRKSKL